MTDAVTLLPLIRDKLSGSCAHRYSSASVNMEALHFVPMVTSIPSEDSIDVDLGSTWFVFLKILFKSEKWGVRD